MPTILDSLASNFSPDVMGDIGKALGADTSAVSKGIGVIGPLLLSGMTRQATQPGGAESLMKLLPEGTGLFGNLGGLLSGLTGGKTGSEASPMGTLLGPGVNAIGASLSRTLGFNVTPLLAMAAPALLGMVGKAVKSDKLDAGGLASMLGHERDAFTGNPANKDTMALVTSAITTGDQAGRDDRVLRRELEARIRRPGRGAVPGVVLGSVRARSAPSRKRRLPARRCSMPRARLRRPRCWRRLSAPA